jgi:hypothetical protein
VPEHAGVEASDRIAVLLLIAMIVILIATWQPVGRGIARIHMVMKGIERER